MKQLVVSASSSMDAHRRTFPLFFLWILLPSLLISTHEAMAADTLSLGQSLSGTQTIVSKDGSFELGFFTRGNSTPQNHYIGIWYNLQKVSTQTVIWVANRDAPISDPSTSELKISEDGSLLLLNPSKTPVWSSNSPSPTVNPTVAVLHDTGNLVLADHLNRSAIAWQSFDHPTDTYVPGAWLGINKITGEYQNLTSWKSPEDPASGPFSFSIDPNGSTQFFVQWNRSERYWTSGEWDESWRIFNRVPEMTLNYIYNYTLVETLKRRYLIYSLYNKSIITRAVMDMSGQVKQFSWLSNDRQWFLFWSQPRDQCEVYSLCGPFGVCNEKRLPYCGCFPGFEPTSAVDWNLTDWSGGCQRKSSLRCNQNSTAEEDKFLPMPSVRLPANPLPHEAGNAMECERACLGNCSCTAYSYNETGCFNWHGDLRHLQQLSDGAQTLHLRLAASYFQTTESKTGISTKVATGIIAGATVVALIVVGALAWVWWRRRSLGLVKLAEGSLVAFKYRDLQYVTRNFAEKLGGGGFGSVFKGVLLDSSAIAVKMLEGLAGLPHGEKQFRTEVSTLGTLQHVNLVRLRGFCVEGSKKLLVYDYMAKGSLDAHLFRSDSKNLVWKTRYQIILGVARGLAYLHEKCRNCIIHCDIKPENILLDENFSPKVADFGMAKLLGRDFSRVLTTMRGTIGYLAPEWISGLPITPKADAYSYGMMLLEVISGKRNTEQSLVRDVMFYPVWAAMKVNEGETLSLLDENIQGEADMEEVDRACRVACWCIQDHEANRPSMGQVVQILEGVAEVKMPPIPKYLQLLMEEKGSVVLFSQPEADKQSKN